MNTVTLIVVVDKDNYPDMTDDEVCDCITQILSAHEVNASVEVEE
jgi:hypothetical protein